VSTKSVVDSNYKVMVSTFFKEEETNYGIRHFAGRQILLPKVALFYPSAANLDWHRREVFQ
jgi:putative restriction endonuclease